MIRGLSVIIPVYNESGKITETLIEVAEYLRTRALYFEILAVNDGSRDASASKILVVSAQYPEIRLLDNAVNAGKGSVIRQGIAQARFSYCLFMDADNSTRISEWSRFEDHFEHGASVVVASRHLAESRIVRPQPFGRRFFGAGYRALCRILFGLSQSDFNCGFKAYETSLAKKIYSQTLMNDWTFDTEVFLLLNRGKARIVEVPVTWAHEDKPSSGSLGKTVLKSLYSLLRLKRRFV
jgi:glycosyltransferase involved in cell wall biosynthesis